LFLGEFARVDEGEDFRMAKVNLISQDVDVDEFPNVFLSLIG
jgi:hypothetical protein